MVNWGTDTPAASNWDWAVDNKVSNTALAPPTRFWLLLFSSPRPELSWEAPLFKSEAPEYKSAAPLLRFPAPEASRSIPLINSPDFSSSAESPSYSWEEPSTSSRAASLSWLIAEVKFCTSRSSKSKWLKISLEATVKVVSSLKSFTSAVSST